MVISVDSLSVASVVRSLMGWSVVVITVSWSMINDREVIIDIDVIVAVLSLFMEIFWVLRGVRSFMRCSNLVCNLMDSLKCCFMSSCMCCLVSNFVSCLVYSLVNLFMGCLSISLKQ